MSKSTFIPAADHDFLIWFDRFLANLSPEQGVSESDLAALKTAYADFHAKTASASNTAAIAKQATAEKNDSRHYAEILIRAETRRICVFRSKAATHSIPKLPPIPVKSATP